MVVGYKKLYELIGNAVRKKDLNRHSRVTEMIYALDEKRIRHYASEKKK